MVIEFDPRLLEETVSLALRATASKDYSELDRYQCIADQIDQIPDPQRRDNAFQNLQRDTFERLGLHRHIQNAVEFFPDLKMRLARLVLVCAERRKEETELFHHIVNGWSLLFYVRTETFIDPASFRRLAMHELSHASDMLDPEFHYVLALHDNRHNDQQRELVQDRFRCLWDICIDARLTRRGQVSLQHREWHEMNFFRRFGFSDLTRMIFSRLWNAESDCKPTAVILYKAALSPDGLCELARLSGADRAQSAATRQELNRIGG